MKVIIGISIALVIGSIASSNLIGMIGSIKAQLESII